MTLFKLVALATIVSFASLSNVAMAKSYAKSSGSTTTYYNKGKPVGKAITHGNTTTVYNKGKPVGKLIRR